MSTINTQYADLGMSNNAYDNMFNDRDARSLSRGQNQTDRALTSAIESGNQSDILKAQRAHDKQMQKFNLLSQMFKSMHDSIMAVIRNIG